VGTVKKCQHNGTGTYEVIDKYCLTEWKDTGEVVGGRTVYQRKVVEKIKCPLCKGIYLRGFSEIEFFNE